MSSVKLFKTGNANCCVVGCSNTYGNTPSGTAFYSFPNQMFPGRKEQWLNAIRRLTVDGKPWQPTKNSKVCSFHFVGGRKSDHPESPAFVPSIMPDVYRPKKANCLAPKRFQRLLNRRLNVVQPILIPDDSSEMDHHTSTKTSIGTQTDICSEKHATEDKLVVLFCESVKDGLTFNVGVQTDITEGNTSVLRSSSIARSHKKCGPDVSNVGFNGFENIKDNDEIRGLCGVNLDIFSFLLGKLSRKVSSKLSFENRLMLFLVKLKLGLSFAALGVLFDVHRTTASTHFFAVLEELLSKCADVVYWPSRLAIKLLLPAGFENYPNVRCIIDCTELRCERPSEVKQQVLLYSNYKGTYTIKYLIGITPNGFISYISNGYGGRTTDAYITSNCGFLDLLEPGDEIMADKGFPLITSDLEKKSVKLIMPAFATPGNQFSKNQLDETYRIASVRIHVERAIARIRMFHVLDKVTIDMIPFIDAIMCCTIVNLQYPLIRNDQK